MMNKVRIGIVGLGRMGITHYSIINTHPNVEIVSVSDTSNMILNMLGKYLPNLKTYTDYKEQLRVHNLDGVIVSTPSPLHYDVCKMAAENNIAVFCEKPFCINYSQANELAVVFKNKNLINNVGYVYRYEPVFRQMKTFLSGNLVGNVSCINAEFYSATIVKPQSGKGWRAKRENGGGALFEMGSHVLDLLEFLFGKPERLIGSYTNKVYSQNVEDVVSAELRYSNEVLAHIHVNWCDFTYRKPMMKLIVFGDKGKMQCDLYGMKVYLREDNKKFNLLKGWTTIPMNMLQDSTSYYVRGNSFTNQLYAFADAICDGKKNIGCTFMEAVDTQRIIHDIFSNK